MNALPMSAMRPFLSIVMTDTRVNPVSASGSTYTTVSPMSAVVRGPSSSSPRPGLPLASDVGVDASPFELGGIAFAADNDANRDVLTARPVSVNPRSVGSRGVALDHRDVAAVHARRARASIDDFL